MAKFVRMDGTQTDQSDPLRDVWYSLKCGYWTDNWENIALFGPGIPCCPHCGCPGMHTEASDWFGGAQRFEENGHPGYLAFLIGQQEKCGGRNDKGFLARYEASRASA